MHMCEEISNAGERMEGKEVGGITPRVHTEPEIFMLPLTKVEKSPNTQGIRCNLQRDLALVVGPSQP